MSGFGNRAISGLRWSLDKLLLSGLFYISNPIDPIDLETGKVSRFYFRNQDGSFGPWESSKPLAKSFLPNDDEFTKGCNPSFSNIQTMLRNRGTQYSGRMREVVQVLQGKGVKIEFNFQWCRTHGIYINPENSSEWWVIEVDNNTGVSAWKLGFSKLPTEYEGVAIPGIPKSQIREPRVLLNSSEFFSIYNGAEPYYAEMGWAFSYDGTECQNIFTYKPDIHKRAKRWKISIDSNETGEPISASLSLVEEKFLYGSRANAPKYPHYTPLGRSLLSLDMFYDEFTPPDGEVDAPLDVFYLDTGEDVVVRYGFFGVSEETTEPPDWPGGGACSDQVILDTTVSGDFTKFDSTLNKVANKYYPVSNLSIPFEPKMSYTQTYGTIIQHTWVNTGNGVSQIPQQTNLRYLYTDYYTMNWSQRLSKVEQFFWENMWFKGFFDRESFGYFSQEMEQVQYGSGNRVVRGAGGGTRWTRNNNASDGYSHVYPSGACNLNFSSTNLGNSLASLNLSQYIVSRDWAYTDIPGSACPPDNQPGKRMSFPILSGNVASTCASGSTSLPSIGWETVESLQEVHVFNPKLKTFHLTHEGEYDPFSSFTQYIDNPLLGSQLFFTYFDVFSGEGFCSSTINEFDQHFTHGGINESYPTTEDDLSFLQGWFGIPKNPD